MAIDGHGRRGRDLLGRDVPGLDLELRRRQVNALGTGELVGPADPLDRLRRDGVRGGQMAVGRSIAEVHRCSMRVVAERGGRPRPVRAPCGTDGRALRLGQGRSLSIGSPTNLPLRAGSPVQAVPHVVSGTPDTWRARVTAADPGRDPWTLGQGARQGPRYAVDAE